MLNNLPEIQFVDKDVDKIQHSILTMYQSIAGRTLAKGDPVRLFLEAVAAIIVQQRVLIDYSAKQNLLAYAAGHYLDHLGVLVGVSRLPAAKARTTLRFTLSAPQSDVVLIAAGIRAATGSGVVFEVESAAEIAAGQLSVEVGAVCVQAGAAGNSHALGQINKIVDPLPWIKAVENITVSQGGADIESDDNLRQRIQQAPESFSTAGPDGAYQFWAKSASQEIVDVSVRSPQPGQVELRPLLTNGQMPGAEILAAVDAICNDQKIRPLTDKVTVVSPETVAYDIGLTYYINRDNATISMSIQQAVEQAIDDYVLWQKSKLGRDINPTELIWRIRSAGASRVEVTKPSYHELDNYQVAIADGLNAAFGGLEDG